MKKILLIVALALALSTPAQQYLVTSNLLSTNLVLTLPPGTNTIASATNTLDALQWRYTTFVAGFTGTNEDVGTLKLFFRQTYDRELDTALLVTNNVFILTVAGTNPVCAATNFGEDYLSGWMFDHYELTGTNTLTNFFLWPIQKGYLKDH